MSQQLIAFESLFLTVEINMSPFSGKIYTIKFSASFRYISNEPHLR